jgi:hypothetical protein
VTAISFSRGLAGLAAALGLPAMSAAQSGPEPFHTGDTSVWGKPYRILAPEYPPDLLREGRTGQVDFNGTINGTGAMENVVIAPGDPGTKAFAEAVLAVLPHWRFHPFMGSDCMPEAKVAANRVWFEIVDGKPTVSASRAVTPPAKRDPALVERYKRLGGKEPNFPGSMIRQGVQARTYARLELDPAGRVTKVAAKAYSDTPDARLAPFENAVRHALGEWTYVEQDASAPARTLCFEVVFSLRN